MAKYYPKIIFVLLLAFVLTSQITKPAVELKLPVINQTDLGFPVRLKIPKLNVDTSIEQVGITSDGAMDVPKQPDNVAWFNLGPRPGENGNAVIDGHSGWKNNKPAVFDNLSKLQKGDKIYIENNKGVTTTFVVRDFRSYNPKADASLVFNLNDGKAHLNLITCSGLWNELSQSHNERLVVFTDKVLP